MAITAVHYFLVRSMLESGVLPQGGSLLEIGEANMYGDVAPQTIAEDIRKFVADDARREALLARLEALTASRSEQLSFDLAKLFYDVYYRPVEVQAIDYHGVTARKLDLNLPVTLDRHFDVVINHGTAEHIFNIAQVFRTIHDYTVPGGMMIHEGPFTGWIEHGFYNLQPTLFYDLAEANAYRIVGMFIEDFVANSVTQIGDREHVYKLAEAKQIPDNSTLFVVLRKSPVEQPFQLPVQGYYRQALPQSGMDAWRALR